MEDEAIGVKEVMKILKYSESQVYKMVASGALKILKIPGVRFSKRYIMSILNTGGANYNPECAMLERRLKAEQEKNRQLRALLVEIANRSLEGVKKEVLD
ncbi:helix-turn-helix domain-containing protein [Acidaminococcus timonensis]|uniref:helix-turn-helix domain-containing protein n=1 Tax=Acidaminococcus timonensis TaxID=1871002 RepID=UPI002941D291|nr:helix-turn-helix domain-containing protein [Acidaminococcus timonensis]